MVRTESGIHYELWTLNAYVRKGFDHSFCSHFLSGFVYSQLFPIFVENYLISDHLLLRLLGTKMLKF